MVELVTLRMFAVDYTDLVDAVELVDIPDSVELLLLELAEVGTILAAVAEDLK